MLCLVYYHVFWSSHDRSVVLFSQLQDIVEDYTAVLHQLLSCRNEHIEAERPYPLQDVIVANLHHVHNFISVIKMKSGSRLMLLHMLLQGKA